MYSQESRYISQSEIGRFIHASRFISYGKPEARAEVLSASFLQQRLQAIDGLLLLRTGTQSVRVSSGHDPLPVGMTVFITDLAHSKLHLLQPLPVVVERAGEQVVAYSYDLDEIALGDSEASAIDEMRTSVAEVFYLLKRENNNLGPLQQRHWNFLRRVVREQE